MSFERKLFRKNAKKHLGSYAEVVSQNRMLLTDWVKLRDLTVNLIQSSRGAVVETAREAYLELSDNPELTKQLQQVTDDGFRTEASVTADGKVILTAFRTQPLVTPSVADSMVAGLMGEAWPVTADVGLLAGDTVEVADAGPETLDNVAMALGGPIQPDESVVGSIGPDGRES